MTFFNRLISLLSATLLEHLYYTSDGHRIYIAPDSLFSQYRVSKNPHFIQNESS